MDATDDQDITLQKSAPELIFKLKLSIPRFLWKSELPSKAHTLVLKSKTDQLIQLLEPFQEWPQLLDQHLKGLVENLASAFIDYLTYHGSKYRQDARKYAASEKLPLPRAICKILYTLCKVRGQKVIVQLLNNEAKYMEPMLSALETWGQSEDFDDEFSTAKACMIWEERFIMLLWLSLLMLAPFDLVTMSSDSVGSSPNVRSMRVNFLTGTTPVAKRLVCLCIHYLGFASKEREAASVLLARLALRRDTRSIGLQGTLIDWALLLLDGNYNEPALTSIHILIGVLSFLAKFIMSADTEVLKPLLMPTYQSIQRASLQHSSLHGQMTSSPLARKLVIKISRALAVAGIKMDSAECESGFCLDEDALNEIIDKLLSRLEDKDTSVRVAASKALSVISVQLKPGLVVQIVEIILEMLKEDTLFEDLQNNQSVTVSELTIQASGPLPASFELSLANVSAVKWHGFVLTLSQLIFHNSMPMSLTYEALKALDLALSFEQRASSGAAIGTNVRDAACFGLWALARRYTTMELSTYNLYRRPQRSIFQDLAKQLVVAATLDPAGNIRRGASAALQELIGRHPNTIMHGMRLVEVVDYNAVALRSWAMIEVAVSASKIDKMYWDTILNGLLGWRGITSADAQSRRHAAKAIGLLTLSSKPMMADMVTMESVRKCLRKTALSDIGKRHGLLLAMAEVVLATLECTLKAANHCLKSRPIDDLQVVDLPSAKGAELWRVFYTDSPGSLFNLDNVALFQGDQALHLDSPLIAEAVCFLLSALASSASLAIPVSDGIVPKPSAEDLQICMRILNISLRQSHPIVVLRSSEAAESLFHLLDTKAREELILEWAEMLRSFGSRLQGSSTLGVTAALGAVFAQAGTHRLSTPMTNTIRAMFERLGYSEEKRVMSPLRAFIVDTLVDQINHANSIELRCCTLRSLTAGVLESEVITGGLAKALHACLQDHTTDQHGDVGSLVRMEAIDAVAIVLHKKLLSMADRQQLAARVCGLAVEKLDKVRIRAWNCLQPNWNIFELGPRPSLTISDMAQTSSTAYFEQLISLNTRDCVGTWVRGPFLEGYVTSAGSGSETVLRASREAFTAHTNTLELWKLEMLCTHIVGIIREHPSDESLTLPTLEFVAFLCDTGILHRLTNEDFGWWHFFNETQKAVAKSSNIRKIKAAICIYAGCAIVERVKTLALKKLCRLLLHRFPKIREAAADALLILTEDWRMVGIDWSKPAKELKSTVDGLRTRLGFEGNVNTPSF